MGQRSMAAAAAAVAPLLLPAIVLLLSWCVSPAAAAQPCTANDLAALRGFSAGLDAPVSGWPPPAAAAGAEEDDDCCSWPGVLCGGSPAIAVVELSLPNRTLRGQISGSLSGLPSLRVLNLSGNALRGPLPPEILLNLQSLQILDLSSNAINNLTLPSVVSTSLRVFNVSGNSLTGPHPVLPGAINLTVYEVSGNALTGAISAAALCRESPNLKILRLSMNRLDGLFPTGFSRCGSLAELALDGNGAIHGSLPEDLFKLESLQTLILHGNSLSGAVSPLLRRLTSLVRLDISFNGFSGELPEAFDGMAGTLQELSAAGNLVSGQLPATLSLCSRLRVLNLRNNSLSGAMAARLDGLLSPGRCGLVYLDLGVNKFTGGIPAGLAGCSAMTALNLGRNSLAGEIPSSFAAAGAFPALSFLSLTGNGFSNVTSALTTLQRLPKLTSLVLTKNFHGGEMMPALGIDGFANLEVLVIANCELSGEIPPWLTGMKKLKVLDLSWNRLSGAIPPWLGEFERLFYLDVSNNSLRGEIPGTLASMPGLVAAGAGEDDEEAAAVQDFPFFIRPSSSPAAKGRQYNQVSSFPPSLVLSRNGLAGRIPPAMGALTRVHVVDLSWNKLSGPIPPELAGMTSLESFDASRNELTGPIPASLTGLSFLSHFSVAFNGLSGQIPLGGQFSTFSRADFEGNPLLCGRHVGRRCDRVAAPQQVINGSKDRRSANAGVVAAICVGTVMLLAAGVVATWRMWSKRRQEDNARVAADDDDHDVDPEAARLSKMVLLFPDDDDETDGVVKGTRTAMSVEEVVKATGNFAESRIVGCGGFGMVYRATLSDGCDVAVKRLSGDTWQAEREFQAEVDALSHVSHHRNLVSLRGYCRHVGASGDYRLLIYPYMENGSLDHWLHERGSRDLPWPTRMRIAVGAARGLAHLHDGPSRTRVLHRDVKSSNILLDGAMEARLGDFGLSRLARAHDDTHVTTDLVGTLGYIPPEYGHSAVATCRGDVYSMGVVLVELVTGRRPVDMAAGATRGGRRDVTSWAVRMRREGKGEEVVDIDVARVEMHRDEAMRVLDVACACVREDPKARPTAQQVADRLDAIADATDSSSSSGGGGGGVCEEYKDVDVVSTMSGSSSSLETGGGHRPRDCHSMGSRFRVPEEDSCDSESVASNFEFHKERGTSARSAPVVPPFSKALPSKWDDAQKWIASPTTNRPGRTSGALPRKMEKAGFGGGRLPATKVVLDTMEEIDTKRIDPSQDKREIGWQKAANWATPDPYPEVEACTKTAIADSAVTLSCDSSTTLQSATACIPPPPTVRSVSMRDMGTEMTPIASQEPSRTGTPVRATSPDCSQPTTPRRTLGTNAAGAVISRGECSNVELSEQELQMKTRREIMLLGTQLGKTSIAAWASKKEEEKDASLSLKTVSLDQSIQNTTEIRAAAWEEAEKAKYLARFKREEIKIHAWEDHQKAKIEAEMRKIEVEVERMRARAQDKLMSKLASARHAADEQRATAETKRDHAAARTAEQAEHIRRTGRMPPSLGCWNWCS